jgi:hypothetical protein
MKNLSKKQILLYIVVLLLVVSVIGILIMYTYVTNLRKEYSIDIRNESTIKERVIKIIPWHGVTNIELSNQRKYWIDESRNYNLANSFIGDNINIGDSIFKNTNSDSLWIKTSKERNVFVIGEWINKH